MTDSDRPMLRLAFRVEGDWWNAYAAQPDTMDGAILLGTIRMVVVERPKRKQAFMDLMRAALADLMTSQGVEVAGWADSVPAPEHERSGRA